MRRLSGTASYWSGWAVPSVRYPLLASRDVAATEETARVNHCRFVACESDAAPESGLFDLVDSEILDVERVLVNTKNVVVTYLQNSHARQRDHTQ
jgi:hypothetical protein